MDFTESEEKDSAISVDRQVFPPFPLGEDEISLLHGLNLDGYIHTYAAKE